MSNNLANLLSALVGAIIGGVASLTGSVLVNRWQVQRSARLRIYDEILPELEKESSSIYASIEGYLDIRSTPDVDVNRMIENTRRQVPRVLLVLDDRLETLRRASVVAGRGERRLVFKISEVWHSYQEYVSGMALEGPVFEQVGGAAVTTYRQAEKAGRAAKDLHNLIIELRRLLDSTFAFPGG